MSSVSSLPYIGENRINMATLGSQVSYSLMKQNPKSIQTEIGEINGLNYPTRTIAYGNYYFGFNLGDSLGIAPIDVILAYNKSKSYVKIGPFDYDYDYAYIGFRYQFVENYNFKKEGIWKGLVVGFGYVSSLINYNNTQTDLENITLGNYKWESKKQTFNLRSDVISYPIELNTGFEIYFLNFTFGTGIFFHSGTTSLNYTRDGTLTDSTGVKKDEPTSIEIHSKIPDKTIYGKMGVEINPFPYTRIGSEIVFGYKGNIAYNLNFRFSL